MSKKYKIIAIISGLVFLIVAYFIADKYFIPEQAVKVNEDMPITNKIAKPSTSTETQEKGDKNINTTSEDNKEEKTNTKKQKEKTNTNQLIKQGSFVGTTGHKVQGNIKILNLNGEKYLRFENYQQTQGPDVFVYLTPSKNPTKKSEISKGIKIPIDDGPDGGEITKIGSFNQKLPSDINLEKYNGVAIWCDAFSVPFGYASLK